MGDSITEGTIVEWVTEVGKSVQEGDVVAMIETDKVTIEVKADAAGIVTQHFGKLDETIEVGADLYELDTQADAPALSSEAEESIHVGTTAEILSASNPPVLTSQETSTALAHRKQSIHFLGKDGWAKIRNQKPATEERKAPSLSIVKTDAGSKVSPYATNVVYDDTRVSHPMYGRPQFTDSEIQALLMGFQGEPDVIRHSTGAKFKM